MNNFNIPQNQPQPDISQHPEYRQLERLLDETSVELSEYRWKFYDLEDDYRALDQNTDLLKEQHNLALKDHDAKLWEIITRHSDVFSLDMVGRRDATDLLEILIDELAQLRRIAAMRTASGEAGE